jgi:hypothetical protein
MLDGPPFKADKKAGVVYSGRAQEEVTLMGDSRQILNLLATDERWAETQVRTWAGGSHMQDWTCTGRGRAALQMAAAAAAAVNVGFWGDRCPCAKGGHGPQQDALPQDASVSRTHTRTWVLAGCIRLPHRVPRVGGQVPAAV